MDFGENTSPALADIDADGDLDLIIGSGGYFDRSGIHGAALFYLEILVMHETLLFNLLIVIGSTLKNLIMRPIVLCPVLEISMEMVIRI